MKKKIIVLLLAVATLCLTACSGNEDTGKTQTFNTLPADMELNDSIISLDDVSIYQEEYNYEWSLYATISIDISDLSEEELHWLNKDATQSFDSDKILNPIIYITCEANNLDFDDMVSYGYSDVDDHRVYFFGMMDSYKYNFDESEAAISIYLTQDETYNSGEYELNKTNDYNYYITNSVKDINDMPTDIFNAFSDKLQTLYNSMSDMLQ